MNCDDKRSIEEVIARYELEPALDDVYVEGTFDRDIFSSALKGKTWNRRAIYEIDSIYIPQSLLLAHKLTKGNKQQVIVLARELNKALGKHISCICYVDKDLDHWFEAIELLHCLRWSKYCSIELHFLTPDLLDELLLLTCQVRISNFEGFLDSFYQVLRDLYCIRLALKELDFQISWISFDRCLIKEASSVSINLDDFVDRLLKRNGLASKKELLLNNISNWCKKVSGDFRLCIRGHDFTSLLAWTVNKYKGLKSLASESAIERMFVLLAKNNEEIRHELDQKSK